MRLDETCQDQMSAGRESLESRGHPGDHQIEVDSSDKLLHCQRSLRARVQLVQALWKPRQEI
jgi:hypothetical protein